MSLEVCSGYGGLTWLIRQQISGTLEDVLELMCSCGSVVEHCVSSVKVVGSIPREHILTLMYSLNAL